MRFLTFDRKHFVQVPWVQIGDLWSYGSEFLEWMDPEARFPFFAVGGGLGRVSSQGRVPPRTVPSANRPFELIRPQHVIQENVPATSRISPKAINSD